MKGPDSPLFALENTVSTPAVSENTPSVETEIRPESPVPQEPVEPTPTPLSHKIVMLGVTGFPAMGLIAAIALCWAWGFMGWFYLALMIGGWIISGLGITVGFHRLLTHRSFETYGPIRAMFALMGSLSIEGEPAVWCAMHRRHHRHSDQEGDPHSPYVDEGRTFKLLGGLWHAQLGWLFTSWWTRPELERFVPDLLKDPWVMAINRTFNFWVAVSLITPTVLGYLWEGSWRGAVLGLIWGGLVRVLMTHHITWSINSICHVFGSREYDSGDRSTNNLLCGLLGHGEGWHNNHHAFPTSARHGLKWWQFDFSWIVIRSLQFVGLAWNVRLPSKTALDAKRL